MTELKMARDGAPKKLTVAAPVVGHKRQTSGDLHPYLHGQTVDDSVPQKSHTKPVPVHPGMASHTDRGENIGNGPAVLHDAAALGSNEKPD
jgi:cytochrome c5